MKLSEVARGQRWMTAEERQVMKRFVLAMRRLFHARGVRESPLLTLRVADVGVHVLMAQRLEQGLMPEPDAQGEALDLISGSLADQIGKARERLRKAIRELEEACTRSGAPIDVGIADHLLPLVRETRDLLHGNAPVFDA